MLLRVQQLTTKMGKRAGQREKRCVEIVPEKTKNNQTKTGSLKRKLSRKISRTKFDQISIYWNAKSKKLCKEPVSLKLLNEYSRCPRKDSNLLEHRRKESRYLPMKSSHLSKQEPNSQSFVSFSYWHESQYCYGDLWEWYFREEIPKIFRFMRWKEESI